MANKVQAGLHITGMLKKAEQLEAPDFEVGLVSMDDLIHHEIGIHPYAIAETAKLDESKQETVIARVGEQDAPAEWYVTTLTGLLIKAAKKCEGQPLKVKLSGADSYSRKSLLGSELEADEVNPLIGLRGVSRFADRGHRKAFELECEVIKRARNAEGMTNIELVIPFVRTCSEAATIIDLLAEQGLCRGMNGLKVNLLCELPANALLAEKFLPYFDGMVIDIDQLGQFALGLDQDHPTLNYLHDDQNEAIQLLLKQALSAAEASNKPCDVVSHYIRQAPKLQKWLQDLGIKTVVSQ